ncbi:MAG: ATP synthase F1 subunit delta [Firmicutes bacterium]|nr:ATP synthase F1 subunit delta [Bacillota bacterium]
MTNELRQYALAVFTLAIEKNELNIVRDSFSEFIEQLDKSAMHFMKHPLFKKSEKKELLDKVIKNSSLKHFLFVLIDNDRFQSIKDIHQAFEELVLNQQETLMVTVWSKTKLSKADLNRVKEKLEKDNHQKIVVENKIDEMILAGHRIEYSGYIHDTSVNRKLTDLVSELKKN